MKYVERQEDHYVQGGINYRHGPQILLKHPNQIKTGIYRPPDDPVRAQEVRRA